MEAKRYCLTGPETQTFYLWLVEKKHWMQHVIERLQRGEGWHEDLQTLFKLFPPEFLDDAERQDIRKQRIGELKELLYPAAAKVTDTVPQYIYW